MINTSLLYEQKSIATDKSSCFRKEPLSYRSIKNGVIAGQNYGGVFNENNEFINGTGLHSFDGHIPTFNKEKIKLQQNTKVIYLGYFNSVWGHVITDCISRFWFLKVFAEQFPDHKLVYIPYGNFNINGNLAKVFEYLGVNKENVSPITSWQQFDEIIIPDRCFDLSENGRYFTQEYLDLITQIKSQITLPPPQHIKYDKVFLTYSNYKKNRSFGEQKLTKFFAKQGFKIIAPENYTFEEQIAIFSNCKCLASTIGSCSHNSIFMQNGAQLILLPRANFTTNYQTTLNFVNDLDVTYIDSQLSVFTKSYIPWDGPFYYYVSENLLSYFGYDKSYFKNYLKYNFKDFKKYCNAAIKLGTVTNHYPCKEYEKLLNSYLAEYKKLTFTTKLKRIIKKLLKKH